MPGHHIGGRADTISLIHWTRVIEHDNFALSVAGIPPGLNFDLTLTLTRNTIYQGQVKK